MKRSFLKFLRKFAENKTTLGGRQFSFILKNGIKIYYSCGKFPKKIEIDWIYLIRDFSSKKFIILEKNKCPIYLNKRDATKALVSLVRTGSLQIEDPSIGYNIEQCFCSPWGLIPYYLKTFSVKHYISETIKFGRYYLEDEKRGFEIILSLKEKGGISNKFINIIKVKKGYLIKTRLINLPHKIFTEKEILYFISQVNRLSIKFIEKEDLQKKIQKIKFGRNKKEHPEFQLGIYMEDLKDIEEKINIISSSIQTKLNEKEETTID